MIGQFVKACRLEDIEEGRAKQVEIENRTVILAKYNGAVFALENMCTHDGGLLGEAEMIDGQIECPRHGARFDITSGEATRMPAVVGLETFEVKFEDGEILVAVNR